MKTTITRKTQTRGIRFEASDAQRIEEVAERLGLKVAEVIRRATRVGLAAFDSVKLPGGGKESTQ